jgi:hypothetical protein
MIGAGWLLGTANHTTPTAPGAHGLHCNGTPLSSARNLLPNRPWELLNWVTAILVKPPLPSLSASLSRLDHFLVKLPSFSIVLFPLGIPLCIRVIYQLRYDPILSLSPDDPDFASAASPQPEHPEPQDLRASSRSHN